MALEGWRAKIVLSCIKVLVLIHDIVTLPFYFFTDKPWKKWEQDKILWSKLEDQNDPYSCYIRQVVENNTNHSEAQTMDKMFEHAVEIYGERKCFGVREVFGEEEETVASGKVFKKLSLGEYKWMTYNEAGKRVDNISRGLLSIGIKSRDRVAIFAETRVEWILTAQALFRINAPLVTLYATLGEDGLIHCIDESEVNYIVTSSEQLPKLKSILPKLPAITHVVCMKGVTNATADGIPDRIQFITFDDLEQRGENNKDASFTPPAPEDLAILMYTSGSSGVPKGVMITHRNVTTCVKGFDAVQKHDVREDDTYIAFLPAAHVLELASECYLAAVGVKVGFSSPLTLTDFSTAVKKGEKGDLAVLKPTMMVAVPLMLDRIRNSILQFAGKEGSLIRMIFDFAMVYKQFWVDKGFQTPKLNRNLLKTCEDFVGGNLKIIMCGGAPLSTDTQNFIRSCLNVQVLQCYGLTETSCCATVMSIYDHSVGRVGAPLAPCRLRLVDWVEGKYFVTDKPNPRGEIVIGGVCITDGYYKNELQTYEAYKFENGQRWFYTGDIGEVFPGGTFKIIDRKKDLVKLQFGEYIALGKVESLMKTNPLVENICVFGNINQNYLVALVIPNEHQLKLLAEDIGKKHLSYDQMCSDAAISKRVEEKLKEHAMKCRLYGSEVPKKIRLCSDEWTPESEMVTATLKLRRKCIENHYKDVIDSMYSKNL